jgi:DNA-binding IclR family transcriptional regulator
MRGTAIARKKRAAKGENSEASGVRTVHVTVKVLDALAEFREPARITDLANRLNMTLPRVSRHVSTLRSLGFIEKAEPLEAYRLGSKLFALGQAALQQNSLASVAHPHLLRLRDQVRHTILLSTASPRGAAVLMCLDSGEATTVVIRPGTVLEFPQSPAARLFFAFAASANEGPAAANLANALMDYSHLSRRQLEAKMAQVLEDYYDFSPDARNTGIGAIAAPIFNHENRMIGAVSIVMPTTAFGAQPDSALIATIKGCATKISVALGSSAWERVHA